MPVNPRFGPTLITPAGVFGRAVRWLWVLALLAAPGCFEPNYIGKIERLATLIVAKKNTVKRLSGKGSLFLSAASERRILGGVVGAQR